MTTQREIKFRAWTDRNGGEMIPHEKLVIWNNCFYCNDSQTLNGKIKGFSVTRVMQSTGLTDKNGREIYEGDILKEEATTGQSFYTHVIFDKGMFCTEDGNMTLYATHEDEEVVGNIYENPELLK